MLWDLGAPAAVADEVVAAGRVARPGVGGSDAQYGRARRSGPDVTSAVESAPDAESSAGPAPDPGRTVRPAPDAGSTVRPAPDADSTVRPAPDAGSTVRPAPDLTSTVSSLVALARSLLAPARESAGWAPALRQSAIAGLDDTVAALTAARAHLLHAEQRVGTWAGNGDRDFAAWRGRVTRSGAAAASTEVRAADVLASMPAVEQGLAGRSLSQRHVDVLARTAAKASPTVATALAQPEQQQALAELGRRLDGRDFATAVDRWAAALDPVSVEREHAAQRERRHLHVTDTPGGTQVRGLLDLRAGHRLRLALEAASPRPTRDDERTIDQRRADALVAVAEHALSAPDGAPAASIAPHVSVILTEETWAALQVARLSGGAAAVKPRAGTLPWPAPAPARPGETAESADPPRSPEPTVDRSMRPGTPHEDLAEHLRGTTPPADEEGDPIPVSEVARLLCDCELTRVVVDAQGRPIDVGRTQRLYSGHLRRAVIARDRGCVWSGCGARARWCEVHHIRWWDRDRGETSVDNGALLCSYHHHEVHRRDLMITRSPGDGGAQRVRQVTYTFRTRAGRLVASDHPDLAGGPSSRAAPVDTPHPSDPVGLRPPKLESTGPVDLTPPGPVPHDRVDPEPPEPPPCDRTGLEPREAHEPPKPPPCDRTDLEPSEPVEPAPPDPSGVRRDRRGR